MPMLFGGIEPIMFGLGPPIDTGGPFIPMDPAIDTGGPQGPGVEEPELPAGLPTNP